MLQLSLLLWRQLVSILKQFDQLFLCELNFPLKSFRLVLVHNLYGIVFVAILFFVNLVKLVLIPLDVALAWAITHPVLHDVLTFTFFFLRDFVDDLLLALHHCLLGGKIFLSSSLFRSLSVTTFKSREEVIHKYTLARLDLSLLLLSLLFIGGRLSFVWRFSTTWTCTG